MNIMKAVAFRGTNQIAIEERPVPIPRAGEAVIRITTTTICGTDVHIVKGEYAVRPGLILGHEPVGVIEALGDGLEPEYHVGQRVVVGAITPCGQCFYCLNNALSQCGGPVGGWRFGNTIDGPGPNTCSCRTRGRISRRFPMDSRTNRSCSCRTSSRPA